MTLTALIDLTLSNPPGDLLYDAQDAVSRATQNSRGQGRDVRTSAVLAVIKRVVMFGGRPLTADERSILEGLRPHDNPQAL